VVRLINNLLLTSSERGCPFKQQRQREYTIHKPGKRAYHLFALISLSSSLSSACWAMIRFSLVFSSSSALRSFELREDHPPILASPAMDGSRGNPMPPQGCQNQPPLESEIPASPNTFLLPLSFPPVVILQESRILSGPIFGGQANLPGVRFVAKPPLLQADDIGASCLYYLFYSLLLIEKELRAS